MSGCIMCDLKALFTVILAIIVTHTLFFIIFSYCMSGDAFLALRNFYGIMYNIR